MFPNIIPIRCRNYTEYNRLLDVVERLNDLTPECPLYYAIASRGASGEVDGVVWVDVWSDSPGKLQHFTEEWQVWNEMLPMIRDGLECLYKLPANFEPTPLETTYHQVDINKLVQDMMDNPPPMVVRPVHVEGMEVVKSKLRRKKKSKDRLVTRIIDWILGFKRPG